MSRRFEWDTEKANTNLRKHGVSFEEAETVFDNPLAFIFADELHSEDEYREFIIGFSVKNRMVSVSFTERGDIIRIISARRATKREFKEYEENLEI